MKRSTICFPVALCLLWVVAAYSQSLADLAKKEQERRAAIKDARVISDEEAAKLSGGSEPAPAPGNQLEAQPESVQGEKSSASGETAGTSATDPDEPVDFEGRPESYWRKTMTEARQKIKTLENEADALVLKVNKLRDDFLKQSDGFYRETIQRELHKSYYEQDLNKENLEKARRSLEDLEKEARKSGALPGWIEE